MEYLFPITAINRGGETRIFYDAEALWAFIRDRSNGYVGGYWREAYTQLFNSRGNRKLERVSSDEWRRVLGGHDNDWILRDDRGRVVDKEKIPAPPIVYKPRGPWAHMARYCKDAKRRAAERGLPIPGTRCFRGGSGRQGAWSKNGKNGAHNQRKGIKLFEDPIIKRGDFDDL